MKTMARIVAITSGTILALLVLGGTGTARLEAKDKPSQLSANDPTLRLYALLDSKYNGKLDDFCMLADAFNDPKNPGQQQHVIRVEYNKDRGFGKLNIHVRTVGQLTPEQLKAYSPKQIFDFAEADTSKFTKTDPGPFGKPGDVYFESPDGGSMGSVATTPEIQAQYERFVTQFLIPALEKKAAN